jgi:TAT (twin-arginine translocation) pathway signal sequence
MSDSTGGNREPSRRDFLKAASMASAVAVAGGHSLTAMAQAGSTSAAQKKFVAMQISPQSFVDEGVEKCLDILQQKGGANVIMPTAYSYGWELDGRQVHGRPLPDHGVQAYDEIHGGSYTKVNPGFYKDSPILEGLRAPELGNFDTLADVIPKAKQRGIQTYALFAEDYNPAFIPNFEKIAEVDVYGKIGRNSCHNNPGLRSFLVSLVQDWFSSNDLDGMMWESERQGPLNTALKMNFGPVTHTSICCFCQYCMQKGHQQGIDGRRARAGYIALDRWVNDPMSASRDNDGSFVTLWRLFLEYPEILAWHSMWFHSQEEVYGLLYGTVKQVNPKAQVGWHIMHLVAMSPFYRADQSYARLARIADFLKPSPYNNCGGPRFAQYIKNVQSTMFRDFTPQEVLTMHYKFLGYEGQEASLDKLPAAGFTAEYVAHETKRAIADVKGAVPIYPGIDIDLPTNEGDKQTQPADVKAEVLAAFNAGAPGVVLSRKYSEMKLTNLAAVGEALHELRA